MTDFAKELSDMMTSYDTARMNWINTNGTENGFDEYVLAEMKSRIEA